MDKEFVNLNAMKHLIKLNPAISYKISTVSPLTLVA